MYREKNLSEALAICNVKLPRFHADLSDQKPMRQTRKILAIAQQSSLGT